jgi:hypothetical protein
VKGLDGYAPGDSTQKMIEAPAKSAIGSVLYEEDILHFAYILKRY